MGERRRFGGWAASARTLEPFTAPACIEKKHPLRRGFFVCQEMYFWKKPVMPSMAAWPSGRSAPVTM